MWSSYSRDVEHGVISATVCCILQSCECVLSSIFQSGFKSASMPEAYSGGKVVDVLSRIGWHSGRDMVLEAYFRQVCCSRTPGGGRDASNSMGMIKKIKATTAMTATNALRKTWYLDDCVGTQHIIRGQLKETLRAREIKSWT